MVRLQTSMRLRLPVCLAIFLVVDIKAKTKKLGEYKENSDIKSNIPKEAQNKLNISGFGNASQSLSEDGKGYQLIL